MGMKDIAMATSIAALVAGIDGGSREARKGEAINYSKIPLTKDQKRRRAASKAGRKHRRKLRKSH